MADLKQSSVYCGSRSLTFLEVNSAGEIVHRTEPMQTSADYCEGDLWWFIRAVQSNVLHPNRVDVDVIASLPDE